MTELIFEVVSATNFAQKVLNIFHKLSRSVVGWQSTDYAVTPIQVLFKLQQLSFVTEIYLHPKLYKSIKAMEVFVSDNSLQFNSVAKIFDFNDGVRIEIASKCKYLKFVINEKEHGKAASIDFLRVYGHQYFKSLQSDSLFTQKQYKIDEILLEMGMSSKKWEVDNQTLITLFDMSKLKQQLLANRDDYRLKALLKDFEVVLEIGRKIKQLQNRLKYVNAKEKYGEIRDIDDQIKTLKKRRDHYDEKYETTRFQEMICMGDSNSKHDQILRSMLEQDKRQLQLARLERERQAKLNQNQIDKQFDQFNQPEWWKQKNQLDQILQDQRPIIRKKSEPQQQEPIKQVKFNFDNPYVYNQGDADMQRFIKPLLTQFGGGYFGDPELLRKYQQLNYLDVLGARIWVAAHSQNWRQRSAAVQAVLDFAQSDLPQRYNDGKTRNLFLALMQFARITAEDKVLQIYYTSLKIMSVALAPPICGQDVSPALVNKSVQKFLNIIIQKISEMNTRAKEISMKTLISIFKHPATDINIAIYEALKICKQQLNVKFVPVDKQNPRIIQSRLEIIEAIITGLQSQKKKINYQQILNLLVEGSLHHSHNDIRLKGMDVLMKIHRSYPQGTIQWFKSLTGLKPNISAEIENRLQIS